MRHIIFVLLLLWTGLSGLSAQNDVVQFSGRVLNEEGTVPYFTNVVVKGTSRGTVIDTDGFFSMPVSKKDTILFSRIGYALISFQLPQDIEEDYYSQDFVMEKDTVFLPEAIVLPWPDKDFFEIEFLALEIDNYLQDIAEQNLAPEKLAILTQVLPVDGGETAKVELRAVAQAYYSVGQFKPQPIFNPLSWKKFIEAIKNGDFKKRK